MLRKLLGSGLALLFSTAAMAQQVAIQNSVTPKKISDDRRWSQAASHLQHVIIIMQENRSFDSYFGTFPGANGIPQGTCIPVDPGKPFKGCVVPFHDPHDVNAGGPHSSEAAQADLDNGITLARMDGFVLSQGGKQKHCHGNDNPNCSGAEEGVKRHDVAGFHDAGEIPNYWAYATNFVLQDNLFESSRSWSLPAHLYLTSEWVAKCTNPKIASTCVTASTLPRTVDKATEYPWSNLFQLLDAHGVSWKYYLGEGQEPDCEDDEMTCDPQTQQSHVPSIWNPAPYFSSVKAGGQGYLAEHNPPIAQLLADLSSGTLPQISWVVPSQEVSEHPPAGVTAGMEYVTSLVNAVMQSPYWQNTAIFVSWDDWGGFYDHVAPPNVDRNNSKTPIQGFGLRVPGLLISAYARHGFVDHAAYSFDSYATFFENLFLAGARLDPASLRNPDARPDIRDALTSVTFLNGQTVPLGDLLDEFDFEQAPQPPLVLSTHIPTGIQVACRKKPGELGEQCQIPTVTISWQPVGNQQPGLFTYHVTRDGVDLPQCVSTASTCTDTPGSGAHLYRAYSVDTNGVASPASAAAEADES